MSKLFRPLMLACLMGTLAGGAMFAQDTKKAAQDPKKTPDATKKAEPKVASKGTIEIYEGKSGWRFRIKDSDGKVIAMPTKGYEKKEDALKILEDIKGILKDAKPTEVKE